MTYEWKIISSRVESFWVYFETCDLWFFEDECCYMCVLFIIIHSFISEIGRTSVQWWPGSEKNYGGLTSREGHGSERNQRHGNISNIPLIPLILVPHAFWEGVGGIDIAFALLYIWLWLWYFIICYYYPILMNFAVNIC